MKSSLILSSAALVFALVGTGCESTGSSSRIQEKSAVFGSLTPDDQNAIKKGAIDIGYSADMVYMALGKPSKTSTTDATGGKLETWVFNKYYGQAGLTPVLNQPSFRYNGSVTTPNAPRSSTSLGSTSPKDQPNIGLAVPDMVSQTLTIYFLNGKVVNADIKTDK